MIPYPGGPTECICLFLVGIEPARASYRCRVTAEVASSSLVVPANSFKHLQGIGNFASWSNLVQSNPRTRLFADRLFEAADIPLCSGLQICSPPRSFPPLRLQPQGGRGFDIRAERASLPPHAPDLLTVRIQAIDGTRTFTSQDSQPCRLLPTSCRFRPAH